MNVGPEALLGFKSGKRGNDRAKGFRRRLKIFTNTSKISPTPEGDVKSSGKKIVLKVASVLAASGSAFVLSVTSETVSPASVVALSESQVSASVCGPPSMANCKEETMQNYLNYVTPMVEKFFSGKYNGMSGPPKYYFIPKKGPYPQSVCRSENGLPPLDDAAYEYCSDEKTPTIYLAQEKMWNYYHNFGHIAPAVGLAHEWGHHIQFMAKLGDPKNDSEYLTHELQDDCVAGAWIQYSDQQGWFEGRGGGSIKRVADGFSKNPDSHRSHGTAKQREEAMLEGFNSGLGACNEYYPEHPIIPG